MSDSRTFLRQEAINRPDRYIDLPLDENGRLLKVSQYFGENVFYFEDAKNLTTAEKDELKTVNSSGKSLSPELAKKYAKEVLDWGIKKGASHFCHWFQPLTGSTAEKHDAFLSYSGDEPIEKLSVGQLLQGEPDASSFPNGGSRTTFEARGYTSWDLTSPIFISDSINGKTLCIPTAFVSYLGDALDIKTPLLRSFKTLSDELVRFYNITGNKEVTGAAINVGCEQEYFLVDKAFYFERPDLVMTNRTLLGSLTSRNQQLDDHYFGKIPERVLSYMQEVEYELYKLGIPAKTRHNEVAPGQFELAPIFKDANIACDQNQLVMATLKAVADRHHFVCLMHEKPFAGINGSGKHVNWSIGSDNGQNLFEPGDTPQKNTRFLAGIAMTLEAVYRHSKMIRASIASHSNDHRLGANEAPPSIISVFLGDTVDRIFTALECGKTFSGIGDSILDMGAEQLATLSKDNTDRNRTSPFAFTGNKFEFRAVGSTAPVGTPLTILNAAMSDVLAEANDRIEKDLAAGKEIADILSTITLEYYKNSKSIVFNGDGYSDDWVKEAESRGLPNLRTTPDALAVYLDKDVTSFLSKQNILREREIQTRYNVLIESYNTWRGIEFETLITMVEKFVLPSAFAYKEALARTITQTNSIGVKSDIELEILRKISYNTAALYSNLSVLTTSLAEVSKEEDGEKAHTFATELMPLTEEIANLSNKLEAMIPDQYWTLPTYFDMLFLR